jgi:hypothetical protein
MSGATKVGYRAAMVGRGYGSWVHGVGVGYRVLVGLVLVVVLVVGCVLPVGAWGDGGGVGASWGLELFGSPTVFGGEDNGVCLSELNVNVPVACDALVFTATDVGGAAGDGSGVRLGAVVPAGLRVRRVSLRWSGFPEVGGGMGESDLEQAFPGLCSVSPVQCVIPESFFAEHGGPVEPDQRLKMTVYVTVNEPVVAGAGTAEGDVSGGGAGSAQTTGEVRLGEETPAFGLSLFSADFFDGEGLGSVQAGGHPYEFSTRLGLVNVVRHTAEGGFGRTGVQDLKDVVVDLPLGMVGSALSAPACTLAQLSDGEEGGCPADSVVGHIFTDPEGTQDRVNKPVYHLVSEHGVAAEFGFVDAVSGTHVLYAGLAPTADGYVLQVVARELSQIALTDVLTSFYGDPAARDGVGGEGVATFTNPSSCTGEELETRVYVDSWQAPGVWVDGQPDLQEPGWAQAVSKAPPVVGCNLLRFAPSMQTRPETTRANTPTGLDVDVKVPQSTGVDTLATPPLRDVVVNFPAGMAVNPAAANGLAACSLTQAGVSSEGTPNTAGPVCPEASKVGSVELETPTLAGVLHGSVYLAKQTENPFGSLLALYMVIDDPATGLLVKLPGRVQANPVSGQLTASFEGLPQLPASEVRVHLFGGPTAALRTPSTCGTYTVTSQLTPWSAPDSGPPAELANSFSVTEGANGAPCTTSESQQPYHPSMVAGTGSNQAGSYSPFSFTLSREDSEQTFGGVSITLPPGLLGAISSLTPCPEPQASQGTCGPESQIGEVSAAVGVGSDPYWVTGGKAYLSGPYQNAPFGLSIIVPTTAGPYTLTGNDGEGRELIRARININPATAQVTVTTTSPLPTILEGIPLEIKTIHVEVNHPKFILNPTSCEPMSITGTTTSSQGATSPLAHHYEAANCATLPFKPSFTATSKAKHTRRYGAYLQINVKAKPGEANIKSVLVQLPQILPSRTETLKQACPQQQYETNPAGCPAGSIVGTATATTPILPVALTGPAIFVSHGGAAFPDLDIVLQGDNITVTLTGNTNITKHKKAETTTSNFKTLPDVPINTFQLTLPPGPHSALTATNNLCTTTTHKHHTHRTITMPTTITAQNNTTTQQNTTIHITDCPKTHTNHTHTTKK